MKNKLFFAFLLLTATMGSAQTITTFAGTGVYGYTGDGGPATAAKLRGVRSIVFDKYSNCYFQDQYQVIRKIATNGTITTYAGRDTLGGYSGDGGQATDATFAWIQGLAMDTAGNLFVSMSYDHVVRKIAPSGIVSTFAGNGSLTYSGDGGPATAAGLGGPTAIAADRFGNVYIQSMNYIRKVNAAGIISTIAGTGADGYSGDGGSASAASVGGGAGSMTTDSVGNLYLAERDWGVVRKFSISGTVTTIAGSTSATAIGDGGPATDASVGRPWGIGVSNDGNTLFIADYAYNRIRKVDASGLIYTIAGNGVFATTGEGGPATSASICAPAGLAVNLRGQVVFDDGDNRIRTIGYTTAVYDVHDSSLFCNIYPNPSYGEFTVTFPPGMEDTAVVTAYNSTSAAIFHSSFNTISAANVSLSVADGVYQVVVTTPTRRFTGSLLIRH